MNRAAHGRSLDARRAITRHVGVSARRARRDGDRHGAMPDCRPDMRAAMVFVQLAEVAAAGRFVILQLRVEQCDVDDPGTASVVRPVGRWVNQR
jgi:hypothetical protein